MLLFLPPLLRRFRRDLGALLGRQLGSPRGAAFESTETPERHGVRIFGGIRLGRLGFAARVVFRNLAGSLLDDSICELVGIARTGFA